MGLDTTRDRTYRSGALTGLSNCGGPGQSIIGPGSPGDPQLPRTRGTFEGKEVNTTMAYLSGLISYLLDRDEEGQGLAEYALILALIAIVAIVALIFLGGQVSKILSTVGASV